MRDLTKSQIKLLDRWFSEAEPSLEQKSLFGAINTFNNSGCLSAKQWEELERINDTEVLWQNVNNYLNDKLMGQVD